MGPDKELERRLYRIRRECRRLDRLVSLGKGPRAIIKDRIRTWHIDDLKQARRAAPVSC